MLSDIPDKQICPTVVRRHIKAGRLEGTAGLIAQSARSLYETYGVATTSMADVARDAKVSRSLLYYYFADKQALTQAVIEDYIGDFIESISIWNELRIFGNTPKEVENCAKTFRRTLYDSNGKPRPMVRVLEELGMRDDFITQVIRESVSCLSHDVVSEYAAYHQIEIKLVAEMFCVVLAGVARLYKVKPEITDAEVATIIAQTLHLDMRVIDPPHK